MDASNKRFLLSERLCCNNANTERGWAAEREPYQQGLRERCIFREGRIWQEMQVG